MKQKNLFKWAGNKNKMLEQYLPHFIPDMGFNTFIDGFCGSATVAKRVSSLYPDVKIVLNDTNKELIDLYRHIAYNTNELISYYNYYVSEFLSSGFDHETRKGYYYTMRDMYCLFPHEFDQVCLSAMLLFMMKINFNGIWKQYKKMGYRYSTPPRDKLDSVSSKLFDQSVIVEYAEFFRKCDIYSGSYDQIPLDNYSYIYFYADPPYRNSDIHYHSSAITASDQQIKILDYLNDNNHLFSMSNIDSGDGFFQDLCKERDLNWITFDHTHQASRISKDVVRQSIKEILIKNF